ncbi:PaaI family thioesterase [Neobacillus niacini]|uniref:PaaI family thioesterase n=1 Tax=Neobacillus niacini TaxID=86668 RepID=UPI003982F3E7
MKDVLHQLLNQCIEKGTEEDLHALTYLLEGFQKKIDKPYTQYIDGLLHMERKIDKEKKTCEITVPLNAVWNNSLDIVHGGITATLLDTVMGTAINAILKEGYGAVTNQLNIHYIAPGTGDTLRCKAEIIHHGAKTAVISGEVFRDDGKKIAHGTGTFFIIQKKG